MSVVALVNTKKMFFAIFCCALLMLLAAPAWAQDPCTPALPIGTAGPGSACGVLITITGYSGHLVATLTGSGMANGNPYDGSDDELVGILNNSSVTVGAIRLSNPTSEPFGFDGDGPCNYAFYTNESSADCFNNEVPSSFQNSNNDPFDYEGPNNAFVGVSPDLTTGTVLFNTPILPGGSTWFALDTSPAVVVSIGETQTLATGVTNVFPFGPFTCPPESCGSGYGTWTEQVYGDDLQLTPLSALISKTDQWTVFPIPVPAGPLGSITFGPFIIGANTEFSSGYFGIEQPGSVPPGPPGFSSNNFPTLACTPYTDYSAAATIAFGSTQPTCVEIERDFIGNATDELLTWQAQFDYDIDANSIPTVIGGPHVLWAQDIPSQPVVFGPTSPILAPPFGTVSDFTADTLNAYTGATPVMESNLSPPLVDPPPSKSSGTPAKSVFVSAFDPMASETKPIAAGVTVGCCQFEKPISNTGTPSCSKSAPVNCILDLVPVALSWVQQDTSGNPINNLQLCLTVTNGVCTTKGVKTSWVHLSSIPVTGCGSYTGQNPLLGVLLNLSSKSPGQYTVVWEPGIEPVGCEVRVVLESGTGSNTAPALSYSSPATFEYTDVIFSGVL